MNNFRTCSRCGGLLHHQIVEKALLYLLLWRKCPADKAVNIVYYFQLTPVEK